MALWEESIPGIAVIITFKYFHYQQVTEHKRPNYKTFATCFVGPENVETLREDPKFGSEDQLIWDILMVFPSPQKDTGIAP